MMVTNQSCEFQQRQDQFTGEVYVLANIKEDDMEKVQMISKEIIGANSPDVNMPGSARIQ